MTKSQNYTTLHIDKKLKFKNKYDKPVLAQKMK